MDSLLRDWFKLLTFPSISADPTHDHDCRACAEWLLKWLRLHRFQARLIRTSGKPAVFGLLPGDPSKPVVLAYGHYDVQPPDPLAEWTSPPFKPVLRNGRVYARGAEDNKGQFLYTLSAIARLAASGHALPTVKVLLEGEEECGSRGLTEALPRLRSMLKADILLVTDTNTVSSGAPTLVMGLRGIVHLTVQLSGPKHDLHSGVHGGLAPNPATELSRLLSTLHSPDGRIAVTHFCDAVIPPSRQEKRLLARSPFNPDSYKAVTGVAPVSGDQSFPPAMRTGFRPSIDVNGIHSGYGGSGMKTIIPATATAKLTARLAAGQDPQRCLALLSAHLRKHTPRGLKLDIADRGIGGPGFRLDPSSHLAGKALSVLDRLTARPAALLWEGASIPVVALLREISKAEPLLVGFGHDRDRAHAPNESFSLDQMKKGFRFVTAFLESL